MKRLLLTAQRNACQLLLLVFLFAGSTWSSAQSIGIYESYAILNTGTGNTFYDLLATTINPDIQGNNLGTFTASQPLLVVGGENKTFKCDGGNVTGGNVYYRVYLTSGTAPSFTGIGMGFISNDAGGCGGNQTWRATSGTTNVLTGLAAGTYYLEFYSDATGSPGTAFASNGGNNYKATFTVVEGALYNFTSGTTGAVATNTTGATFSNMTSVNNNGTVTAVSATSASSGYPTASGTNNIGNAAVGGALNTTTSSYFQFVITPTAGNTISINTIKFASRGTGTAPTTYAIRTSVDGYASNIATGTLSTGGTWNYILPTLTPVTSGIGTAITVRIYGYGGIGAAANTIVWRLDDVSVGTIMSSSPVLAISGTTAHGSVCVSASGTPITYTITNTGSAADAGVTVVSNNAQFAVSGLSSTTIAASGGTATYQVTFTPSGSGAQAATITVASTTSGSNSPTSSLTGTGATPATQAVTTNAASAVNTASATLNGNLTTVGFCPTTIEKGFVYSQTAVNTTPQNGGTGVTKTSVAGIATGVYALPLTGLTPATGYSFQAYVYDGTTYTYGGVNTFTTLAAADHLTFVGVPANGTTGSPLATFTVEARRVDNSVDTSYTGNITISKASGPGTLSGTLTVAAVAGVATFSTAQFDSGGTVTLAASSGALTPATSGNIVITLAPVVLAAWDFFGQSSPTTFSATTFNTNLDNAGILDDITRGSNATSSAGGNSFRTTGFQNDGISTANTDYFQTTLKTDSGYSMSLSSITANVVGTASFSVSPGVSMQFAYSLDGTNFTLINSPVVVSGTTPAAMPTISLTGVSALQNIPTATTVYFRYYATGQTSTGGWGFSSATAGTNGLAFNGNILCLQPTAFAITGGGATCTGSGSDIGVFDSETGVSYQLALNGVDTGAPVAGTGSAISFGPQTAAGTYTVIGTNVTGSCTEFTPMTGSVEITLDPASVGGTVSGSDTVCATANSGTLTLSGYTGTITKWQSADDAAFTVNVVDIANGSDTQGYTNLTQTTYYRAVVTSGACPEANSSVATITVDSAANSGTISGDATVCNGSNSGSVTVSGFSGSITEWESSLDNFASTVNPIANTTATQGYTNLNVTTYYRAVISGGACGSIYSPVATITVTNDNVWTGTESTDWDDADNWSCGDVPTALSDVTITATANQPVISTSIAINSLTMETATTLVVPSGLNLTVTNEVETQGSALLTVESNANLLQINDVDNTGDITVERNSNPLMRLDYTLWSAPLTGQNLLDFSSSTVETRFYVYDSSLDQYSAVDPSATDFAEGTGYLIRMPDNHPTTPTIWEGIFTGEANNGDVTIGVANDTYNAVGNPYPSTIDADTFIGDNGIIEALYFWRKTNNAATTSYATYTLAGGAGTESNEGDPLGLIPNGTIQVGQGFIAKSTSTQLVFNNEMRIADNNDQFFRASAITERHRVWLNLTNAAGVFSQTMVSYMTGATQGLDAAIDGRFFNDSQTALTSIISGEEFAIQGRALPFEATDVVPMGFKTELAGEFSISIAQTDGLFETGQLIYLKDNLLNVTHDLTAGAYTFASEAGVFNNRFEVIYQLPLATNTPLFNDNSVVVYKQGEGFVINSGASTMKNVEVFDIRGRLLVNQKAVNAVTTKFTAGTANQVLIVKITSDSGATVTKKVVN